MLFTLNVWAEEKRYIYFISEPPYIIKTAHNCLANSLAGRCTRSMWNVGQYFTWNHISKLFNDGRVQVSLAREGETAADHYLKL